MFAVASLILLSCFAFAVASPASSPNRRATALTCPIFSVDDESVSFTLLAVGQLDDSFRRPLALGTVAGATVLASVKTLAQNLDTNFTLVNNGLYSDPAGYTGVLRRLQYESSWG
ncbi:unnamed protein product [Peniophora sp. CBMAI 1063]|nr:unnamed protein product [Peniophora sp. CBMAI 1063]